KRSILARIGNDIVIYEHFFGGTADAENPGSDGISLMMPDNVFVKLPIPLNIEYTVVITVRRINVFDHVIMYVDIFSFLQYDNATYRGRLGNTGASNFDSTD